MELIFGVIIVFVLAETFEMAPAYGSSDVDDTGHCNSGFTSSAVFLDDHTPVQGKLYAQFHIPAGAPFNEVKLPTSSNKLTSRTYAEFHTSSEIRAGKSELESIAVVTPVYESITKEVNEQHRVRDHYTIHNEATDMDQNLNQSVVEHRQPSLRSTRQFLDILTEHDLVKMTLPHVLAPKPKVNTRGVLDVLLPRLRLQSIKGFMDNIRGLLSSTF